MTEKKNAPGSGQVFVKENFVPKVDQKKNYTPATIKPDANHIPTTDQGTTPTAAPSPKKK